MMVNIYISKLPVQNKLYKNVNLGSWKLLKNYFDTWIG